MTPFLVVDLLLSILWDVDGTCGEVEEGGIVERDGEGEVSALLDKGDAEGPVSRRMEPRDLIEASPDPRLRSLFLDGEGMGNGDGDDEGRGIDVVDEVAVVDEEGVV